MTGTWGIYFNKRTSKGVARPDIWVVAPWNPSRRQPQVGAFSFIELKTECLLVKSAPGSGWPTGVLVVEGELIANTDGTAYIKGAK